MKLIALENGKVGDNIKVKFVFNNFINKDKIRMLKRIKNKSKSLTDYEYVCRIIRKELTKLGGK